ncbi:hypothetical protein ABT112_09500 [Streptomyces sp. NPDC002055]|uniref:hypothetical protein n=1 Tax=Streptomyces sp. NPDC002055 TaxID=3154534 RepID=UPI00331CF40D
MTEPMPGTEPGPEDEPLPLGVTRTPTGRAEVDAQLERLADVDHLPADGHIAVYEDVHRELRSELASLDTGPGEPRPAQPPGDRPPGR